MKSQFDAIVVGGGPAGASCAALLAKKGCDVLLLEKERFPRDKPCGDAIGGKAISVLQELGLEKKLQMIGFLRNNGVVFSSPAGHEVEISLEGAKREFACGYVCKRVDFDLLVFEHAKKSCTALEEMEVVDLVFEGKKVAGVVAKSRQGKEFEFRAKLVVGADGANSTVARKTGCFSYNPQHMCSAIRGYFKNVGGLTGNIEIHFLQECMPGYFWIFPLSKNSANVGVGMLLSDISRKKVNLSALLQKCLLHPKFAERFEGAKMDGELAGWVLPLASAKRRCAGNGFILLGDAASLVDPFSGEGIGNAMRSAKIASEVLGEKLARDISESDCIAYEKALWKEMEKEVSYSYTMQRLGRQQWLLDLLIKRAKQKEWLRKELASMIASKEAKKNAADLLFYLRALLF
ncbi:MAG: geranylgeranyl reductase family protein [Candidatus Micrarchaeota archaeon]|nr:geranylgeranyl reductase family protein [Candidatus Micrarchaeota archaeon]